MSDRMESQLPAIDRKYGKGSCREITAEVKTYACKTHSDTQHTHTHLG